MKAQDPRNRDGNLLREGAALYTDQYELIMAQGYFLAGRKDERAVFDYFFRTHPFGGGFVIFAGLWNLLETLENLSFSPSTIDYLRSKGFREEFLAYLEGFSPSASIFSVREGEVIFPNSPVLRVEANLIEAQLIETLVLNYLNFQSLIATKAARIRLASEGRPFLDFGLRRAHGLGGIHASRAAVIGGAAATSNVFAGRAFDLSVSGTQAHAWIQSFDDELTAFRTFAGFYPDDCILLVDTYDTLSIGLPNAITVARELQKKGKQLAGIRLDSGDLAYLSKKARQMLDEAGLQEVKILASNQLDEYVIRSLLQQEAPIDGFGVGTRLVTGRPDAALDGVYKLAQVAGKPRLKISENVEKITQPGRKKIIRLIGEEEQFLGDGILLEEEGSIKHIVHPHYPEKKTALQNCRTELLVQPVFQEGRIGIDYESPKQISRYVRERLDRLPEEHKRFENPHIYKVGISEKLRILRDELIHQWRMESSKPPAE